MSDPGVVKALLLQLNEEVDRLPVKAVKDLGPILMEARLELQRDLAAWFAKHPGGGDRFTPHQYRTMLAQIEGALDHLGNTRADVAHALKMAGIQAGDLASAHLQKTISELGPVYGSSINPIPIRPAGVMLSRSPLMAQHVNSAARYTKGMRDDIMRQMALGMLRGETIDQLTNRLQRLGGPKGLVYTRGKAGDPGARAEVISEGLFTRYRHWGERLVRTETIQAYNWAATDSIIQAQEIEPGIKMRWDAAVDARLCPRCRALDNVIRNPGDPFPGGVIHPPLHPNCRCAVVVWHEDWTEEAADQVAQKVAKMDARALPTSITKPMDVPKKPKVVKAPKVKPPEVSKVLVGDQEIPIKSWQVTAPGVVSITWDHPNPSGKTSPITLPTQINQLAGMAKITKADMAKMTKANKNMVMDTKTKAKLDAKIAKKAKLDALVVEKAQKLQAKEQAKQAKEALKAEKAHWKIVNQAAKMGNPDAIRMVKERRAALKAAKRVTPVTTRAVQHLTEEGIKNGRDTRYGTAFAVDSDQVENQALRVTKISGLGGPYHEVDFKLTGIGNTGSPVYVDVFKGQMAGENVKYKQWHFMDREVNQYGILTDKSEKGKPISELLGVQSESVSGQVTMANGRTYHVDVGTEGALTNQIRIRVPGLDPAHLMEALEDFKTRTGKDITKPPTAEDRALMMRAKVASKLDPRFWGENIPKTKADVASNVDRVLNTQERKDLAAKAVEKEVYPGHVTGFSQPLADKLKAGGVKALYHDTGAQGHHLGAMLAPGGPGLCSSNERYRQGVFVKGMSTPRDFQTGGADGAFVRVAKDEKRLQTADNNYRLIIDADQLGRTDWWAYDHDNYGRAGKEDVGKRWSVDGMINDTYISTSNEVMFPKGVPREAIKGVRAGNSQYRKDLLDDLKKRNITEINGIPIEDFVTAPSW